MKPAKDSLSVARLIAIKKEELEQHRLDLLRLQQLQRTEAVKLGDIEARERAFVDEMRMAQSGSRRLDAMAMIGSRRYLAVLQGQTIGQRGVCDEIDAQCSLAQAELERVFAEVRALERLAERRKNRASIEEKRVSYLHADDQEITRSSNERNDHVAH